MFLTWPRFVLENSNVKPMCESDLWDMLTGGKALGPGLSRAFNTVAYSYVVLPNSSAIKTYPLVNVITRAGGWDPDHVHLQQSGNFEKYRGRAPEEQDRWVRLCLFVVVCACARLPTCLSAHRLALNSGEGWGSFDIKMALCGF